MCPLGHVTYLPWARVLIVWWDLRIKPRPSTWHSELQLTQQATSDRFSPSFSVFLNAAESTLLCVQPRDTWGKTHQSSNNVTIWVRTDRCAFPVQKQLDLSFPHAQPQCFRCLHHTCPSFNKEIAPKISSNNHEDFHLNKCLNSFYRRIR